MTCATPERPKDPPERCFAHNIAATPIRRCTKSYGHDGPHEASDGTQWVHGMRPPAAAPPPPEDPPAK
jgi:hypothetical protein